MAHRLLIVMANTDPRNPSELGPPFSQAAIAAAMEYEVEVIFTGQAGELAIRGVAQDILYQAGDSRTAYDVLREAHEAGVKFKACTTVEQQWGHDLIPEIDEVVGGAYLISEAMDDDTVTLTY